MEVLAFAKQRKPFQVQYGLKKHVKNAGIPVFTGILMAVYQYLRYLRYRSTLTGTPCKLQQQHDQGIDLENVLLKNVVLVLCLVVRRSACSEFLYECNTRFRKVRHLGYGASFS